MSTHSEPDWSALELELGRQTVKPYLEETKQTQQNLILSPGDKVNTRFTDAYQLPHMPSVVYRHRRHDAREGVTAWLKSGTSFYPVSTIADKHDFGKIYYRIPDAGDDAFRPSRPDFSHSLVAYQPGVNQFKASVALGSTYEGTFADEINKIKAHTILLEELADMPQSSYDAFFQMLKDVVKSGHCPEFEGDNLRLQLRALGEDYTRINIIDPGRVCVPGQGPALPETKLNTLTPDYIKRTLRYLDVLSPEDLALRDAGEDVLVWNYHYLARVFEHKVDKAVQAVGYPETVEGIKAMYGSEAHKAYVPSHPSELIAGAPPPISMEAPVLFMLKELEKRQQADEAKKGRG